MKKTICILILFFIGFWALFVAFQNTTIYNHTLGKISKNYVFAENGERIQEKKPFTEYTNTTVIQWDGEHYQTIKNEGYNAEKVGDYMFAFFPMFSIIWRLTGLPAVGTVFLNFLMFAISIILLARLFKSNANTIFIICSLPLIVVYLIPYTEATFLLMSSIAIYGYFKNKYWLYFIGLVLASLSRNAFSLILPAIFCAEILFLLKEKQVKQSIKQVFFGILPIIIGTAIFVAIQYLQGSGSLFKFIEVQKQWGKVLSIPNFTNLTDWSHESFSINIPALLMIGLPILVYLICIFLKQCSILKSNKILLQYDSFNKKDYLIIVMLLCCIVAICSVLFYQRGSLNGLSRYLLCSPYFITLLFIGFEKIKKIKLEKRTIFFIVSALLSLIVFCITPYSGRPVKFYHLGFLIVVLAIGLFVFQDLQDKKRYKVFLYSTFVINLIWTCYLFNMYLSNGWLYT